MAKKPPNIIKLEDDKDYINVLVYGESGVGKTVFAGSDNVLFIAPEDDGTLSAKRFGSTAEKWTVKKWDDLQDAYDWIYDNPDHGYKWIVIDSITEMQKLLQRKILDDEVEKKPGRDIDLMEIQDHQKWQNMMLRFVKAFNALPVNMLYTGLVQTLSKPDGTEFYTVDLTGQKGKIAQTVASYMTSYGYMEVKRVKGEDGKAKEVRRITWKNTGEITGKDRTRVLAPFTQEKTLAEISEMIEAGPVAPKPARKATSRRKAATPVAENEESNTENEDA